MSGDWRRSLLGNHIDLLTGYPFSSEEYTDEVDDLRLLRGDNLHQGHIDWTDAKKWPASKAGELKQYFLQEGDVVLAMDRTWVSAGLKLSTIAHADLPCLLVQRVARIRGVNGLVSSFLRHTIESHQFSEYVKSVQTATAVPHISARQIRDFPILLPSAHEQQAIARILDVWDRGIRQLADLIAAKVRFKQGLMQQLLTGKRRFNGFQNCAIVPTRLHDLFEKVADAVEVDPTRMYQEIGIRSHGKGLFHKEPVMGHILAEKRVYRVIPDCLTLNIVFAWERALAVTTSREAGMVVSHRFPMFRPNRDRILPEFALMYMLSQPGEESLQLASPGGAGRNRTLSQTAFLKTVIPLPCIEEQRMIVEFMSVINRELETLEKQLAALKQQKKGLMQKLLTGQVRVKIKE